MVFFGIGPLEAEEALDCARMGQREEKGGFAFQTDKRDYRGVVAGIDGITGKNAVNSDAPIVKN